MKIEKLENVLFGIFNLEKIEPSEALGDLVDKYSCKKKGVVKFPGSDDELDENFLENVTAAVKRDEKDNKDEV